MAMARLDRESVVAHLADLEEAVAVLRRAAGWTARDLAGDTARLWVVAHGLQVAIQNVVDISAHVGAALRAGAAADDYRDAILALGSLGVLDTAFVARIAPMAGLRNIIVHGYLRLEAARLVDALGQLDDFATFARGIDAFLAQNPDL